MKNEYTELDFLDASKDRIYQAITTAIDNPEFPVPVESLYRGDWITALIIIDDLRFLLLNGDGGSFVFLVNEIVWNFVNPLPVLERMYHAAITYTYVWMNLEVGHFDSEIHYEACRDILSREFLKLEGYIDGVLPHLPDPYGFTIEDVKRCSESMQPESRIKFLTSVLEGITDGRRGTLSDLQVTAIEQELINRRENLSRDFFQTDTPTAINAPGQLLQDIANAGGIKVVAFLRRLNRDESGKFIWPLTRKGWETRQGLAFFVDYLFGHRFNGLAFLTYDERRFYNVGECFVFIERGEITAIDSIQTAGDQLNKPDRDCPLEIAGLFS